MAYSRFMRVFIVLLLIAHRITATCHDSVDLDQDNRINHIQRDPCPLESMSKCVARRERLKEIRHQLISALNFSLVQHVELDEEGLKSDHQSGEDRPGIRRESNQLERTISTVVESRKIIYSVPNTPQNPFPIDPMRSYFHVVHMRYPFAITNATLRVHVQPPASTAHIRSRHHRKDHFDLHVYLYENDKEITAEPVITRQYRIPSQNGKWISMDITPLARSWSKRPTKNYGLMIKAEFSDEDLINRTLDEHNRTTAIFLDTTYRWDASPVNDFPITSIDDRSACHGDTETDKCCRYPLMIDFESFGWDFVIAPKRYNAYYCAGECARKHRKRNRSAIFNDQRPDHVDSRSCCRPRRHQDLRIIFINNHGGIEERIIPNAVIQRCSCT